MKTLLEMVLEFMDTNPNDESIERFYINVVLPRDSRSIDEIISDANI